MPDLGDWLANAAAEIPIAGSYLAPLVKGIADQQPGQSVGQSVGNAFASDVKTSASDLAPAGQAVGDAFKLASTIDPSQLVTKPVMGLLHDVGIGQQGDQWDTGLIGMAGDTFDKISRLATFATLLGDQGDKTMSDGSSYNKAAWDMAFSGQNPIRFGEAMMSNASVVTDPNGLNKLRQDINNTWYGSAASGALDMIQMAALDPTKGLGKVVSAGRAAKYVEGPQEADRLATVVNTKLDSGGELPSGASAKVSNFAHALTPGVDLNDATVAGQQLASKAAYDGVTDTNHILNMVTPRLGMGGTAPRAALPVVAEMYADAAKVTSDVALERQIKLNIDYALTGSDVAKQWLADNYPTIAAKGVRTTSAPSEFTLLENAMEGYAARGNVGTPFGRTMGLSGPNPGADFDLAQYITAHTSDPARAAEMKAYGEAIQNLGRFDNIISHGGPDNAGLAFGTSAHGNDQANFGVQIAPRALETLKSALLNKVADEYLYQNGPSSLTMRVLNNVTTTAPVGGYVTLTDPVLGGEQLANHMKEFQGHVPALDGDIIKQTVASFRQLDQQGRKQLVANVNDAMLSQLAGSKYGISGDALEALMKDKAEAIASGRKFASDAAQQAATNGENFTALTDLTGTPTWLNTAHLQNHLDTTAPLLDFDTADQAARAWQTAYSQPGMADQFKFAMGDLKTLGLQKLAAYHSMWKIAMLGRLGLLPRAQLDTGIRGAVTLGSATMAMDAFKGVGNYLNAHTSLGRVLPLGDQSTLAISFLARQAADRAGSVADALQGQSDADAAQIATRAAQAQRAYDLADTFKSRQRAGGRFTPTTKLYQQKETEARALGDRLSGDATTVPSDGGTPQPMGLDALNAARDVLDPIRQKNIEQLRDAQAAYLAGDSLPKQLTNTPKTHSVNGVMFTGAPVMSDLEAATLTRDVRDGTTALSDILMGDLDRGLYKQRVDPSNWKANVPATELKWADMYAQAANDFHGSYTVHRLLQEQFDPKTAPETLLRSYMEDPAIQKEFSQNTGGGTSEEFQRWLSDLTTSVHSMAPNEDFRQALLSGKVLSKYDVQAMAPEVSDRFPIYGPTLFRDTERNVVQRSIESSFKYLLDLPDVYLARVPYYTGLYQRNIDRLLPAYEQQARDAGTLVDRGDGSYELSNKDALDLHTRAKQYALNDVHRDMYDVSKTLGISGTMRYIAPFFNPWLQAQTSWARMIYDDPQVWGKMLRYSQTPDMFHLTVDGNGKQVNPWDGTQGMDKHIQVPLFGLGGLRHVGLSVGSFNVVIQGNTPFSPGFGPLVQVPAQVLVANVLPNVMDGKLYREFIADPKNPINELTFARPGDVPKSDLKSLFADVAPMPSYAKQLSDVILGDNGFGNTYSNALATRYNYGIAQFRQAHGGADPSTAADWKQIADEADSAARAAAFAKALTSFGLGLSGNAQPIGQYYVDKMHALKAATTQLHALGTTPEQVFAQNYPAAANLNWSFSVNQGNLEATVNATSDYLKYRSLMDAHPDVMWWIAGPDNLVNAADPNAQFSGGAYNTQMNLGLRKKYSAEELMQQDQIAMGAGRWNSFKQAMRLYMTQNGIPSMHDPSAGDLAGLQARTEEQLRQQFPEWAKYMDQTNLGGQRDTAINEIKNVIENPPNTAFNNRPDVKMMAQYLMARDAVIAQAQSNNVTNWTTSSSMEPERAALYAYGYQLASSDLVFHQAWTRLLEGEFYKDLQAAKNAAAQATVLGQTPVGGQ